MKAEEDAYGQEVYDYYLGENKAPEIVEREDGYIGISAGPVAYFAPFAEWPAHQQELMRFANGRILDIGCGAGRVCLHLQEQGCEAVGIDISPLAIKTTLLRGVKEAHVLSITQVSRAKLGVFDTIVMMGNNFGLFGSYKRAKWLLRRFYGMTTENGRILVESRLPAVTSDPLHLDYQEFNRQRGRMPGQLRLRVRYKKQKTPWFEYLIVSLEEMAEILAGTGWQMGQTFLGEGGGYTAVIEKM
ncbi:MAG: class I SAM-dependent methyltransferase [Chloroflexi bacterium]|nr:class I SAM-dependent methyltransferase [Chloroflexota bacterium]